MERPVCYCGHTLDRHADDPDPGPGGPHRCTGPGCACDRWEPNVGHFGCCPDWGTGHAPATCPCPDRA